MKIKNLFFGSLLLAVPFTACTDDELVEMSQPQTGKAISLGEDFTISGSISGAMGRALYQENADGSEIKSLWEPNDSVGGAWYAALTKKDDTKAAKNDGFLFNKGVFASNHPFTRVNKTGNVETAEFGTITNAFAGKYVLYYPYDATVAKTADVIPVKINTAQVMDVASPLAHINDNMFIYTNKEYTEGGNQASDFTLQPVPVLFRLQFRADETTRGLVGKTISKVVLETNSRNMVQEGRIVVGENTTGETVYAKAEGKYEASDKLTTVYTLDLKGNENNTDYQIAAVGNTHGMKKPVYISTLPLVTGDENQLKSLTFKVITTEGDVYQKTIDGLDLDTEEAETFNEILTAEGGYFNYAITLDEVGESDGAAIYTVAQFEEAWEAALKSNKAEVITLGAPMNLESLEMDAVNKNIRIEGSKLTVGTLTVVDCDGLFIKNLEAETVEVDSYGKLVTENAEIGDLTVGGNATLNGISEIASINVKRKGELEITNVDDKSKVTGAVVCELGSSFTNNSVTMKGENSINGVFDGEVTVEGKTTYGANADVTAVAVYKGEVVNNGTMTHEGVVFKAKMTNNGLINVEDVTFEGTTVNNGSVVLTNGADLTNKGDFANRGILTLPKNATENEEFTNEGTLTLDVNPVAVENGTVKIVNKADKTLNVKTSDIEEDNTAAPAIPYTPANLVVVNNGTMNVSLTSKAKVLTVTSLNNEGTVNISKGDIVFGNEGISGTKTKAQINIAEDAVVEYTGENTYTGYIVIAKDANLKGEGETDKVDKATIAWTYQSGREKPNKAESVIIASALTVKDDAEKTKLEGYNLVLRANITLDKVVEMTMQSGTSIVVEGEVELKGTRNTDNSGNLINENPGKLTASESSVKLNASADGALLRIGSYASLAKSDFDCSGNIVAMGGTLEN